MPKAELIATLFHGDGKPWDVSTDRALANNFNLFQDAKSCAQSPMLVTDGEKASASLSGQTMSTARKTLFIFPHFCGLERLSTTITRALTVAPRFRSADGGNAYVRVTVSNQVPTVPPASDENTSSAGYYGNPQVGGVFSQSTVWSTTSTTWQVGADYDLDLGCKSDLGYVWIVIEGSGVAECTGLSKCRESARVVA